MSDRYEKIALSKAVNRTAQNVKSGGFNYEFKKRENILMSSEPIRCGTFRGRKQDDLTGKIFDRLNVIGFRAKHGAQSHGRWVCKCLCGNYIVKKGPTLRNPNIKNNMCDECFNRELLKNKYKNIEGKRRNK